MERNCDLIGHHDTVEPSATHSAVQDGELFGHATPDQVVIKRSIASEENAIA